MQPLKLLAAATVEKLSSEIGNNLERYQTGDFSDMAAENGWAIETSVAQWDETVASKLSADSTPDSEVKNSLLIYNALPGLTPAMARDERIWARLCHVECLQYARDRWLSKTSIETSVRNHFFAGGFAKCRDDNAIGRLWWNAHVAKLASPDDVELGLRRILSRANIRLQIIDRADTAFRQPLVAGIIRLLDDEWLNSYDAAVADFMYEVNKASGGKIFEALDEKAIDAHLLYCLERAKLRGKERQALAPTSP